MSKRRILDYALPFLFGIVVGSLLEWLVFALGLAKVGG